MPSYAGDLREGTIEFFESCGDGCVRGAVGTMVRHSFPVHVHRTPCAGEIVAGGAVLETPAGVLVLREGERYVLPEWTPHALRPLRGSWFSHRVVAADRCLLEMCGGGAEFPFEDLSRILIENGGSHPRNFGVFAAILSDVEREPERDWRLADLARRARMRPVSFSRAFSREIGLSPKRYQLLARVWKSVSLLKEGATIPETAFGAGFADQSHLCRIFRRYMGVAPSTFLRNLSETSDLRAARD